jgi:hypothetical protein
MEAIKQLKDLYDEGLMTKEEYDERRLQVINDMTLTEYDVMCLKPRVFAFTHLERRAPPSKTRRFF